MPMTCCGCSTRLIASGRTLAFAAPDPGGLVGYLGGHPEVSDVVVTGGDPMILSTMPLRAHLEPLHEVPTVATIRIGTKSLACRTGPTSRAAGGGRLMPPGGVRRR